MHATSVISKQPEPAKATTGSRLSNRDASGLINEERNFLPQIKVQTKMTVGAANDPLEEEAEQMATTVMRMPEAPFIQRQCAHCEEEEKLHRRPVASFLQRKAESEGFDAGEQVTQQINGTRGSGSTLPGNTKQFMESRFESDFTDVRVHTGEYASNLSRQLNAQAFTVGNDVYFDSGKFSPDSSDGRHLLAHELTHVVQQNGIVPYASKVYRQETDTPLLKNNLTLLNNYHPKFSPFLNNPVESDLKINWFEMKRPFYKRGAENLIANAAMDESIRMSWMYNFNFIKYFGLSDKEAAEASNFITPFAIDFVLEKEHPTLWEKSDAELGTSTFMISPTLLYFDIGNIAGSVSLPAPLRKIFGGRENPYNKDTIQRKCSSCDQEEKLLHKKTNDRSGINNQPENILTHAQTMIARKPGDDESSENLQIMHADEKKNWARKSMLPFSFRADKVLPVAKKDVQDHPLMIWAISKVYSLSDTEAAEYVKIYGLIWYESNSTKEAYKIGDVVNFQLSASSITMGLDYLAASGKISMDAAKVFNELVLLQSEFAHRDYTYFLKWLGKRGIPAGSITDFSKLTPEGLEKMKGLIKEFNENKYASLRTTGLLADYLLTEDIVRDTRFEELKDKLLSKKIDQISAADKAEVLKLFQDKAMTTAFYALEESKIISKKEYNRYKANDTELDEVAGIITGYSLEIRKNIEGRIKEFIQFRNSYYQIDDRSATYYIGTPYFNELNGIAYQYESNHDIEDLFDFYRYRPEDLLKVYSIENMTRIMAEAIAVVFQLYALREPGYFKTYRLPEKIDHPFFWKFKAQFSENRIYSSEEIMPGCTAMVLKEYPNISVLQKQANDSKDKMMQLGAVNKHEILKDLSQDFRRMKGLKDTKNKILEILNDKPGKADETRSRLSSDPDLIWEFGPLLYYVLKKESLDESHPMYKIVDDKIKAVADKSFWESIGLAALGLVLGIAGIFTGGATTAIGIALISASAAVSLYDLISTYSEHQVHSEAYEATFKVPFTTEQSSFGVVMALFGLVLDVAEVAKAFAKTASAGAKLGKAAAGISDETVAPIADLLAGSKNIDEYAEHLSTFLHENKLLKPGVTKEMARKGIMENFEKSQQLIAGWKAREGMIQALPDDLRKLVDDPKFAGLPAEIKETVFKISDENNDAFEKIMRVFTSDPDMLRTFGYQVFSNPHLSDGYLQLSTTLSEAGFQKVLKYSTTIGKTSTDALPEVINLMNKGNIFSRPELATELLTNRNLQQAILNFNKEPGGMITLWDNFIAKYGDNTTESFVDYIRKETPFGNAAKLEEAGSPSAKVVASTGNKGVLTDMAGDPPKLKAFEGLEDDIGKLRQKVKDPLEVKDVTDSKFVDNYDVEVDVDGHTFRRNKITGKWCRFSDELCNLDLLDEIDEAVQKAFYNKMRSGTEELAVNPWARGYAIEDFQLEYLSKIGYEGLPDFYPRIDFFRGGTPRKYMRNGVEVVEVTGADVVSVKSTWVTKISDLERKIIDDMGRLLRNTFRNRDATLIMRNVNRKNLHLIFEQGYLDKVIDNPAVLQLLDRMTKVAKDEGVIFEWFVIPADGSIRNGKAFLKEMQLDDL